MSNYDFSVIIPHRNSLNSLPRLLNSIPVSDKIQIVIVDNSENPIKASEVNSNRGFELYYSSPSRFAGGARNVGLEHARGKWLIFADADDFFSENAFEVFYSYLNAEEDLVYFKVDSVYDDDITSKSNRHLLFNGYIDQLEKHQISELECKLSYVVPWGKMVRSSLVFKNKIFFDEVLAANDVMFSTKVGAYSKKFTTDFRQVYVVTTRYSSLANRLDLPVVRSRFRSTIKRNLFLRSNKLMVKEASIMIYLYQASRFGCKVFLSFLLEAILNRQKLFVGMGRWLKTYRWIKANQITNARYITK